MDDLHDNRYAGTVVLSSGAGVVKELDDLRPGMFEDRRLWVLMHMCPGLGNALDKTPVPDPVSLPSKPAARRRDFCLRQMLGVLVRAKWSFRVL